MSIERIPASREDANTIFQFTSKNVADPIVARAVCAHVFNALIPAARNHSFVKILLLVIRHNLQALNPFIEFISIVIAAQNVLLIVLLICDTPIKSHSPEKCKGDCEPPCGIV